MKKSLLKICVALLPIIGIIACSKHALDTDIEKTKSLTQKLEVVKSSTPLRGSANGRFANAEGTYGTADRASSQSSDRDSGRLRVILTPISGATTYKRYIEVIDSRNNPSNPDTTTYYLEATSLSATATTRDINSYTGDLFFTCLDTGDQTVYSISNGRKVGITRYEASLSGLPLARQSHFQCVRGCVNHTMDDMSWGSTIVCFAAFPECCAGVFLACEIDCTF